MAQVLIVTEGASASSHLLAEALLERGHRSKVAEVADLDPRSDRDVWDTWDAVILGVELTPNGEASHSIRAWVSRHLGYLPVQTGGWFSISDGQAHDPHQPRPLVSSPFRQEGWSPELWLALRGSEATSKELMKRFAEQIAWRIDPLGAP